MINFNLTTTSAELEYKGDMRGNSEWVWHELTTHKEVSLSRVFCFELGDLLNPPTPGQDLEGYAFVSSSAHSTGIMCGFLREFLISRTTCSLREK